jgi:hypothetical protein
MDALDRELKAKRERAQTALLDELRNPSCGTCGHKLDPSDWRSPADLKAKVYGNPDWKHGDGPAINLALHDLVEAGEIERDEDHRVRLSLAAPGSQKERWVNAVICVVIPLDDVEVTDSQLAKQESSARMADRVADLLPAEFGEYVLSGRWEDMESDQPARRHTHDPEETKDA